MLTIRNACRVAGALITAAALSGPLVANAGDDTGYARAAMRLSGVSCDIKGTLRQGENILVQCTDGQMYGVITKNGGTFVAHWNALSQKFELP
jgi:hypothetical protein